MRGASGAHVSVHPDAATKVACDGPVRERLRAQYDWLAAHKHAPLVRVRAWEENGYGMELLEDWKRPFVPGRLVAPMERLWFFKPEVELDVVAHSEWAESKLRVLDHLNATGHALPFNTGYVRSLKTYVMSMERYLHRHLTHGDATRVNTMCRRIGDRWTSVLIDPIPATPACADVWAFDVSTMVISLLGFEHIVYDWEPPSDDDHRWLTSLLMRCNPVELECVRYMSVVQVARRIPYFPTEVWNELIYLARTALLLRP